MPPKQRFTREQIVNAAFAIAKKEGLSGVSVRKVANKLGSSTAPIYANFRNAAALLQAVVDKVNEVSRQLLAEQNSGDSFRDIGVASLRFARQYSVLFRDMLFSGQVRGFTEKIDPFLVEQMKQSPHLQGLTDQDLHTLLAKMRIFQLGMSAMVATADAIAEDEALQLLGEAAADFVAAARSRNRKDSR